jgi:hypothetical protein
MPDFCREEITIAQRFAFQAASAPRDSKPESTGRL